ncbi:MAG: CpsD/CapB family tyrosine-protein kinase [Ruminococcus sp.]|nr:CpsD/CapB family tyrosine-protein kinase [Ruminococcus sp.]
MKLRKDNAAVKRNEGADTSEKSKNVISADSKFAIVEGYKIARTNLVFTLTACDNNAVAITSWSKGEGKSTATVNIAISFAKMGKKVLLIDADLRRPNVHNLLKIGNESGVSEIIGHLSDFESSVHRNVIANLDVLTSGAIPPNPSELLASSAFEQLIVDLKEEYDYVILDTPPLGVVADTLLLKEYVAGYVLVVREKITTHGDIERSLQNLRLADSKVLGFLKVGCSLHHRSGYKKYKYSNYHYSYNYTYYRY